MALSVWRPANPLCVLNAHLITPREHVCVACAAACLIRLVQVGEAVRGENLLYVVPSRGVVSAMQQQGPTQLVYCVHGQRGKQAR